LRNLLNIVVNSNRYSKDSYRIYLINSSRFIKNYLVKEQAFEVSCDNENKTSLYNKVDLQEKLLHSILDTIRRLKKKSRVFRCSTKECKSRYDKPNNLSRHIKSLGNNEHKHVANKIKSKFCNKCDKILSKQCDYIRHMRSKHLNVNLGA